MFCFSMKFLNSTFVWIRIWIGGPACDWRSCGRDPKARMRLSVSGFSDCTNKPKCYGYTKAELEQGGIVGHPGSGDGWEAMDGALNQERKTSFVCH